jgi:hypothetical protein
MGTLEDEMRKIALSLAAATTFLVAAAGYAACPPGTAEIGHGSAAPSCVSNAIANKPPQARDYKQCGKFSRFDPGARRCIYVGR